jgi:hypothetical protein
MAEASCYSEDPIFLSTSFPVAVIEWDPIEVFKRAIRLACTGRLRGGREVPLFFQPLEAAAALRLLHLQGAPTCSGHPDLAGSECSS